MFDISLQVRGTTKKGIALKALFQQNVPNDNHIPVSNTCIKCVVDVDENDAIQCSKCSKNYHITCLTHPIPSDFTTMQAKNPCLWWLCMACVLVPEKHPTPPTPNTIIVSGSEDNQLTIAKQLSEMKCEMLNELSKTIETKLENVLSQLREKSSSVNQVCSDVEKACSSSYSNCFTDDHPNTGTTNISPISITNCRPQVSQQTRVHSPNDIKATEVLILSPVDHDTKSVDAMKVVRKKAESLLKGTQVEFIRTNNISMNIVVGFKDADTREQSEAIIKGDDTLLQPNNYDIKSPNKMLPKLIVPNVAIDLLEEADKTGNADEVRESEKKVIIEKVLAKNECIRDLVAGGHTLKVVFVSKHKNKEVFSFGLKVSPAIRAALISQQQRKIYLGTTRYPFDDRYHVKICYHCQMLGHISKNCPDKTKEQVCLYCMGKHASSSCSARYNRSIYQCARCLASCFSTDANNFRTHNGADPQCPVVVRETKRLELNTDLKSTFVR
jgi:hypothetical protein